MFISHKDVPLRIGIVGAGENTRLRHIPGLRAIRGIEIVGVCNRSIESSSNVAMEFDIPQVYKNWQELVADKNIDAVVIGTWPYMHCPITIAALEHNKHVLCEARMAANANEAHRMLDAAKHHPNLVTQIVPSPITLRVDKTVKRLLSEGYIGRVLVVEIRAGGTFLNATAPFHWRQNIEYSGMNIMSLGIWYEIVMRWLGEATHITAMGKTFIKTRKDMNGVVKTVQIPEHLDVVAEMHCGAQLHIQVSNVTGLAGEPELFLFGDAGTLRFANDTLYGAKCGELELKEINVPPQEEGFWQVEKEFIDAICNQGAIQLTTFEDGVKYMEFTEAVVQSMAQGRTINPTSAVRGINR